MDFLQLETIARTDDKQRYTLRFEPLSVAAVEKLNEAFSVRLGRVRLSLRLERGVGSRTLSLISHQMRLLGVGG